MTLNEEPRPTKLVAQFQEYDGAPLVEQVVAIFSSEAGARAYIEAARRYAGFFPFRRDSLLCSAVRAYPFPHVEVPYDPVLPS